MTDQAQAAAHWAGAYAQGDNTLLGPARASYSPPQLARAGAKWLLISQEPEEHSAPYCDHLIRRDLQSHWLPAHTSAALVKRCSDMCSDARHYGPCSAEIRPAWPDGPAPVCRRQSSFG